MRDPRDYLKHFAPQIGLGCAEGCLIRLQVSLRSDCLGQTDWGGYRLFEKTAHKLDNAAILGMLGGVAKEFSYELTRQGHAQEEAESLARQIILESMRAANVNIDDYYSVESWAKAFRREHLRAMERWRLKGRMFFVYGVMMLSLWGGLAVLCWHLSRTLFYLGIPLWGLGAITGAGAIIMGVVKAMRGGQD